MSNIHPTAIVDAKAELAENVSIGPYAVIGAGVVIGAGSTVAAHAVIEGQTTIGRDNEIGVGAVIGLAPQDYAFKNCVSRVVIGDKNKIREYAQIHRGTKENSETVIGNENFLMGFSHVAHNCRLGNQVIVANGALLAGYVTVEDGAFISGLCPVHQFTRIGKYAMMRGGSRISLDLPPYTIADNANEIRGINVVGLSRRGFTKPMIAEIKALYRDVFFSDELLQDIVQARLATNPPEHLRHFLEFIRQSETGICRPLKN